MALNLVMPMFGVDPNHFTILTARLLNIEHEQNMRYVLDAERISPSIKSDSSGICSLATSSESGSVELTPVSSRPETPIRPLSKTQEKKCVTTQIMYKGRDILNLGANIRESSWQTRDRTLPRHNLPNYMTNRSMYHWAHEQPLVIEYPMTHCNECEFSYPLPTF